MNYDQARLERALAENADDIIRILKACSYTYTNPEGIDCMEVECNECEINEYCSESDRQEKAENLLNKLGIKGD